jgi:hypothetical protein
MGETYYVTGTHDGTTARLYINGVEVASSSANAAGSIPSVVWRVGSLTSSQWFNGVIDNAFVYSAELPAEDVLAHYEAGAFMAPLSDDATGNTIVDVVTTITVTAPALLDFGVGLPSDTLNVSDGVTVITNNSSGYTLSFVVNDLSSLDTTDTIPASAVSATLDGQASVGSSGRTSAAGTTFNLEAELILPFVDSGVYNGSIVFTAVTQ